MIGWRRSSLAGAVYSRLLVLVAIAAMAMGTLSFIVADHAIDRAADEQLVTACNVLLALMGDELSEQTTNRDKQRTMEIDDQLLSPEDARAFHAAADWRMFAVFQGGRLIMRSDTGPPTAALPSMAGFQDVGAEGAEWRSFGLRVPKLDLTLIVGERLRERHRVLKEIAAGLAAPVLLLLGATALLLWFSLRSGLFELRRLSTALSGRSSQELERFDIAAWPSDLATLLTTLNRLFDRLEEAFGREQHITDEAAHQLRTPLAAIKVRAQILLDTMPSDNGADGSALLGTIDRTVALCDRLLLLARLEATEVHRRPFDLRDVVIETVSELALVAAADDIEFSVQDAQPAPIVSDAALIAIALVAICENAIKYAPAGSVIDIVTAAPDATAAGRIVVIDRGPGIAPIDRERAFDRFVRLPDAKPGAGLGLSIARRAIGLLGGTILLSGDGPGLTVTIMVPPAV